MRLFFKAVPVTEEDAKLTDSSGVHPRGSGSPACFVSKQLVSHP